MSLGFIEFLNKYKKYRVTDGDTIKLTSFDEKLHKDTKHSIRPTGYDTPEYYVSMKMGWDSYHTRYSVRDIRILGYLASRHLRKWMKENKLVIQSLVAGSRNRKIVKLKDMKLLEYMLKEGYAYPNDNDTSYSSKEKLQIHKWVNYAKENKLGLWKVNFTLMDRLYKKAKGEKIIWKS